MKFYQYNITDTGREYLNTLSDYDSPKALILIALDTVTPDSWGDVHRLDSRQRRLALKDLERRGLIVIAPHSIQPAPTLESLISSIRNPSLRRTLSLYNRLANEEASDKDVDELHRSVLRRAGAVNLEEFFDEDDLGRKRAREARRQFGQVLDSLREANTRSSKAIAVDSAFGAMHKNSYVVEGLYGRRVSFSDLSGFVRVLDRLAAKNS